MQEFRQESDSMGTIAVANQHYWGAQTQRSLDYFKVGTEVMPLKLIYSLVLIKRAAAIANHRLNLLQDDWKKVILDVCDEILKGRWDEQFPLKLWQTGSGTQTNMNVNEVIANRANQLLGQPLGSKFPLHPNDHINSGQSSNDCFPTAMHLTVVQQMYEHLLPSLKSFKETLDSKAKAFKSVFKIGRTHLQDAVPMSLGDEFASFAFQIQRLAEQLETHLVYLYPLAQGGTAIGNGLNCPKGFVEIFIAEIQRLTGLPFISSLNKFEALASHDPLVGLSGILNTLAGSCLKIVNDIRWLASGPRCGLGELTLPANEPGSSIMPGKVNPTQAEMVAMVCCQVIGNHTTVTLAGSQGHFQLNTFKPVILYNVFCSIQLLSEAVKSFNQHCLKGLTPNFTKLQQNLDQSLMGATLLNPLIGYDRAAQVVYKAYRQVKL